MAGRCGSTAKAEAVRLAEIFEVGVQRIYEITRDLRPARKQRTDKGKRTFSLEEGTDTFKAAQLIVGANLDPDQAIETCRVRGFENVPSVDYMRNIMREAGLGKKQRRNGRRAHRRFEASAPGEMFQIDVTALKVRWHDVRNRRVLRIEGIDKNHPQLDDTKVRVWQIMLTDDFSRRRFLKYVTTLHITSRDIVEFECEVFSEIGVPKVLYTDNGSEFKGYHIRAQKILNSLLEDKGGYRHQTHEPGNAQATGKVENAHQWAEKMDRYIGLAIEEGQNLSIDDLNQFAGRVCEKYNNREHRVTGETPLARWHARRVELRMLPPEIVQSALLADESEVTLNPDMSVIFRKVAYKVPGVRPFVDYVGQKVKIVVPLNIDLIFMTLPNGVEYEMEKILATADKAGEFRSVAESGSIKLTKQLKAGHREEIKRIKAEAKQTGEIAPVPHLNIEMPNEASNVSRFPHIETVLTPDEINVVTQMPAETREAAAADSSKVNYRGQDMTYWESVAAYKDRFADIAECKEFLLDIFPHTFGHEPACDVEAAIENRRFNTRRLKAVS